MRMIIGRHYTNDEIDQTFGGSPQRGMRKHKDHMVLISNVDMHKNIYPDELKGNVLYYTGMGKTGDQSIYFMQNKDLYFSNRTGLHIYLFFKIRPNYYVYSGPVKLINDPYYEKDSTGRRIVKFPITSTNGSMNNYIKQTYTKSINLSTSQLSNRKLIKRVRNNESKDAKLTNNTRKATSHRYIRNRNVAELSKRFAKGHCQLCGRKMFIDQRTKEPYLESHHITPLSEGGHDSIFNVIALCPNCHRKLHLGYAENDPRLIHIQKLLHNKAAKFASKI